ncbi:hypothetical protein HRbin19_01545 [bacterium HR19]|nr:hypothetical protein HRbin19_01545 [bacterium HR19]
MVEEKILKKIRFCIFPLLIFFSLSCSENSNLNLDIKIEKIFPVFYDSVDLIVQDESGRIFYASQLQPYQSVELKNYPEKMRVLLRAKKDNSFIAEGVSPIFSVKKNNSISVLVIPKKSVLFPLFRPSIRTDTYVSLVEMENNLFVFTEFGEIFKLDYITWKVDRVGNFTPRRNFLLFAKSGRIFIAGGENAYGKVNIVEFFDPVSGTFNFYPLNISRAGGDAIFWGEDVLIVGGEDKGYCEVLANYENRPFISFPCGITLNSHSVVLDFSEGLAKILVYYPEEGDYEILYIIREGNRFKVSYREKILGIKRREGAVVKVGRKVFAFGGYSDDRIEIPDCESFDIDGERFEIGGKMVEPRVNFSAFEVFGNVIVVGGKKMNGLPVFKVELMRDCFFSDSGIELSFPPKFSGCAFPIFNSYVVMMCEGAVPEIFPLISLFQ